MPAGEMTQGGMGLREPARRAVIPCRAMIGPHDADDSNRREPGRDESLRIEDDVSLAGFTSLGVGGAARHLATCTDLDALRRAADFARERRLPVVVLGGGSNVLVADEGFEGVVVRIADESLRFRDRPDDDHVVVSAGAGLRWDPFVARCVDEGLAGLECLSGIPGRVGAAPIQNIGAYGQEVSETVVAVDVVDLDSGSTRRLSNEDCDFGYRTSRFKLARKGVWHPNFAVTAVHFRLRRKDEGAVRYPDLERRLDVQSTDSPPPLRAVREAVLEVRREKSMVIDPEISDPDDPNRRSAGSFFVNPVVDPDVAATVVRRARDLDAGEPPSWPVPGGRTKFSAAWLIEASGFAKGHRRGRVGISTRHALALVNLGGARAADLMALAAEIRSGVYATFGVRLAPEPVLLGFS